MSMENVKKFMELVQTEESLAKRMVALKDGLQEGEFAFKDDKEFVEKKILPLAKEYGIEFSVEDFVEFTKSQLVELSEEDLSSVSGGLITEFFLSLLAVGGINLAGNAVHAAVSSYFTGGGTSTSTVQSVTDKDVDMSGTAGTEDKGNKIEFDERFKEIKKEFSKNIKEAFDNVKTYMSPEKRSTWMDTVANQSKQISSSDDKYVNARYNKALDRVEFTATWTNKLNDHMDRNQYSQAALNGKLGTLFKQRYQEAVKASQLVNQYNELNGQLQQKQNEKSGYESQVQQLQQQNETPQQTVDYCYNQLIQVCDALIKANPYNNHQFNQWTQALQNKTFTSWDALKAQATGYTATENGRQVNCSVYVDTLLATSQQIRQNAQAISTFTKQAQQAQFEMQQIANQMNEVYTQYQTYAAKQQAFNDNMKTEFDYFYGGLVKALKADEEIKQLSAKANTNELKAGLANKLKEKAEQLVHTEFSKQLLEGCLLVVEQQGDSIGMKIVYGGYWFCQNSFSVDEFISTDNHLEIINSEASKKRDEVAKKLAEYMQKQYTKITDGNELKRTIQSVLTDLKDGKLNELNLGMQIVNSDEKQVTFSSASGGQQRNTILTIERVADEYNKMVNMQALEATRQQNEGTISYTPFGRKIWNSIGSQAQHVLNMIAQIEAATGNLSDVKESGAFENDLKYVAGRILTQGNSPYGLKGDHHTDTSLKAEDLQKIQEFAAKIKK